MKREKRITRVKDVGQDHQVTTVLKLKSKKYKTIRRESVVLTRLIKQIVTPHREENVIKLKVIKREDFRRHQIHQVKWIL